MTTETQRPSTRPRSTTSATHVAKAVVVATVLLVSAMVSALGSSGVSAATARPVNDFDGDGRTDVAVFRPSSGVWYENFSSGGSAVTAWGASADVPVAGDYNGDAKTDVAVFRPSTGVWYANLTGGGSIVTAWGASTDVPVPGDYNGDGKTDVAVFRPSTGVWYASLSGGGSAVTAWGASTDVPVPGDYNGDGRTDVAVFRPSTGVWYASLSGGGSAVTAWGASTDVPVPGDYNGDGRTDVAVFRPSTGVWYANLSGGGSAVTAWGASSDEPLPGDYNGDGRTDVAVFRPSTGVWFINLSGGGTTVTAWGASSDIPIGKVRRAPAPTYLPTTYDANGFFHLNSGTSTYVGYKPDTYNVATPIDLFVWMHGCGGIAEGDMWSIAPPPTRSTQSYIAISLGGRDGTCWDVNSDGPKILTAVTDIQRYFNVNPRKIYLGGYSSGGDMAYRHGFQNAGTFAGILVENSDPFMDAGVAPGPLMAAASWKINIAHVAHTGDTTYPIATVRSSFATLAANSFPATLIEKGGTHYDPDAGTTGTNYDLIHSLLPYLDAGWTSP